MARAYVDENLTGSFVTQLLAFGHDVLDGHQLGAGKSDSWQFRAALVDRRVIVTLDKRDFLYFHRLWTTLHQLGVVEGPHPGVLVAIQSRSFSIDAWAAAVNEKLSREDDLSGHLFRWHSARGDWLEDAWRPED